MIWHYPTIKDDGWYPSKDNAWPVSGAYHILQMKNTTRSPSVIIKKYCVKDHEELGYFDNRKEAIKAYQEYISQ